MLKRCVGSMRPNCGGPEPQAALSKDDLRETRVLSAGLGCQLDMGYLTEPRKSLLIVTPLQNGLHPPQGGRGIWENIPEYTLNAEMLQGFQKTVGGQLQGWRGTRKCDMGHLVE